MSDFLSQQQSDELVNGNFYMGEYQPTEQDLADMAEAWPVDLSDDGDALASAGMGMDEDYSMGDFYDCMWDDGGMDGSEW